MVQECFAHLGSLLQTKPKSIVRLDVRGHMVTTKRATLVRETDSSLPQLLLGPVQKDGSYFVDREWRTFSFVLQYLRDGPEFFIAPKDDDIKRDLLLEAEGLKLHELVKLLKSGSPDPPIAAKPRQEDEYNGTSNLCTGEGEYKGAAVPTNEGERISLLKKLQILQTESEHIYDSVTQAVAAVLGFQIVIVSLVSDDIQWFKSKCGLDAESTPRSTSFCAFTLKPEDPRKAHILIVEDAMKDHRFASNPLVAGPPYIRFYAGAPLVTSSGLRMGALCCIDTKPRVLKSASQQLLVNFAQIVTQAMERPLLEEAQEEEQEEEEDFEDLTFASGLLRREQMSQALNQCVILVWARWDLLHWPIVYANSNFEMLTGLEFHPPKCFPGKCTIKGSNAFSESLWDVLEIPEVTKDKVLTVWDSIRGVAEGNKSPEASGVPRIFSMQVGLSRKVPTTAAGCLVSCRFSPADQPLDASAAVTQTASHLGAQVASGQGVPIEGLTNGHLYFVTMVSQHVGPVGGRQVTGPSDAAETINPPKAFEAQVTATSEKTVFSEDSTLSRRNKKPPTSKFEDVRLLRLASESALGVNYFGLWSGASVMMRVLRIGNPIFRPDFRLALSVSMAHPNLVQSYKSLEADGEIWVCQEWCDGGSLEKHCMDPKLSDGKTIEEALDNILEVARGIMYLHERGILHGCLTCGNVLLKTQVCWKGYVCKLSEFGLKIPEPPTTSLSSSQLTTVQDDLLDAVVVESNASHCISKEEDIFALGVVSLQAILGSSIRVVRGRPTSPFPKGFSKELQNLCLSCVATNPSNRPSALETVRALEEFQQQHYPGRADGSTGHAHEALTTGWRPVTTVPQSSWVRPYGPKDVHSTA